MVGGRAWYLCAVLLEEMQAVQLFCARLWETSFTRHYLWFIEEQLSFKTSKRHSLEEADYRLCIQASGNNCQAAISTMCISILVYIHLMHDCEDYCWAVLSVSFYVYEEGDAG